MNPRRIPVMFLAIVLTATAAFAHSECVDHFRPPMPPLEASAPGGPAVLSYSGDTTWIRVHADSSACPGDPNLGHGYEGLGGPGPLETWCFEGGDSCGTYPPWDTRCFSHVDVRTLPSRSGINFWHVDSYRTAQRTYCGNYAMWCGSDSLWTDGLPVECGTWSSAPGYGNGWNCHIELTLPESFSVAAGCTLLFDPRYDTECRYDYFYVDVWDGGEWRTLATFNSTSNNPGGTCGPHSETSPDYWGNSDAGQPGSCDWQERSDPALPAFYRVITPDTLGVTSGPRFRWRFTSDGAWSDADGRGDTDGGAWLDNVMVWGGSERYLENFESGFLDPDRWAYGDPEGVIDLWHMSHDPDPPYEPGDGEEPYACILDSSVVWRARPEQGYQGGTTWRNGWYYRLMTPSVPLTDTGCAVRWDEFSCTLDYTCDYAALRVRFYDADQAKWCPWDTYYDYWICSGSCYFWYFERTEELTPFYTPAAESVQFAWDIQDVSAPGDFCRGKHTQTEFVVDNVSIGFFDSHSTEFSARGLDLLHDTFYDNLCGYNSGFHAYDPDTVSRYSGPPYDDQEIPEDERLLVEVTDEDGLAWVELRGSVDGGASWVSVPMDLTYPHDPDHPEKGGEYSGTLCPDDFGLSTWDRGTEVWYCVKATDQLANAEYYPPRANPASPYRTGTGEDYLAFSILPMYPEEYEGVKILLVDGYGRRNYDYAPCLEDQSNRVQLELIYSRTLTDAGYCYDVYDISGAGGNMLIHPIWFDDYDAVVWFTGPYYSNYLFHGEAQEAVRDYLGQGGRVMLLGDRIAYCLSSEGSGEDSLGGDYLAGVCGAEYLEEMPGPYDYPYVLAEGVDSISVFGNPLEVDLDTLLVYRECPYPKDMTYVAANSSPPTGYTAQPLLAVANPTSGEPDMAVYTEYMDAGQCVFVNFDLCGCVNHERTWCSGVVAGNRPDFVSASYDGRVELMRFILDDLFGLPSSGGGTAGVGGRRVEERWALRQNVPNPSRGGTEIEYEIGRRTHVTLSVYDARGRLVRCLRDGVTESGRYVAHWDGRNFEGKTVASGVYFYTIKAADFRFTRKLLLVN
jgi:hypothetical protein